MDRSTLTRRRALGLGAVALAGASATGLRRPAASFARRGPSVFSLDLSGELSAPRLATAAGAWRTLPVVSAPGRFDLVGLSWTGGPVRRAEVRARRRGGTWTAWTRLAVGAGGHGPDGARAHRHGTEPCWTGAADELQVRIAGEPRGLTARFVHAAPAAGRARRLHRRLAARRPAVAEAPDVIPRAAWGGDRYPPKARVEYGRVDLAFVHHTVNANTYAPEDSAAIVLGICRYHRDHNGWNDIGYNFLVDRYGQVFEGRAGGIDQAVVGAQAQGYNDISTGAAAIGDHTAEPLPQAGFDALARLLAWKLSLHGVPAKGRITVTSGGGPLNRYPSGRGVTLNRIAGHGDGDATACPGAALIAQLPALRGRVDGLQGTLSPLTIAALATTVPTPGTVTLSGSLRLASGATPAGRPVQLAYQSTPTGAAWELLTSTSTDANGAWTATVDVPLTGQVKAVFPGDGVEPPVESRSVLITVTPTVSLTTSAKEVAAGTTVAFSGAVEPFWPSTVGLVVERKVRGRFLVVKQRTLRVRADGTFRARMKLRRPGRHRATVIASGVRKRRWVRAL